jgi:nucleoid DNA-binding protein
MNEALKAELAKIIREELMKRGTVSIPSLGTFRVEHTSQQRKLKKDGAVVMTPPVDRLHFSPDS